MHPLHAQRAPLSYQQASVASLQVLPLVGGAPGQAAGNGGAAQTFASGGFTAQVLSLMHLAVVRHAGRGSSPQLQWAASGNKLPLSGGGVQPAPFVGGNAGQTLAPPPAPEAPPLALEPPPPPLALEPLVPPLALEPPPPVVLVFVVSPLHPTKPTQVSAAASVKL